MAIQFPCLDTDISKWFPRQEEFQKQDDVKKEDELVQSLRRFLISSTNSNKLANSKDSLWLCGSNNAAANPKGGDENTGYGKESNDNIMSPVLKDLPNSHWLVKNETSGQEISKNRVPNLATSIWLASTSTEPLTCVTRTNPKSSSNVIELPEIFMSTSPSAWLMSKANKNDEFIVVDDFNVWLASSTVDDSGKKVCNMEKWKLISSSKNWLWNNSEENEKKSTKEDDIKLVLQNPDMIDSGMDFSNDDESSIAILDDDFLQENENGFDFAEDADDSDDEMSDWLL